VALATPKLSAVMALGFVSLSIPILIFILVYNYSRTSAAIIANLHEQVAKTRLATIDNAQNLVLPVASILRVLAQVVASDPAVFRTEQSRDLLYRALTSAEQIDAVYVSFEDGYHRVVTRIDESRRRSDPQIPRTANWHSSYIDDLSAGKNRRRHRVFFDTWPHVVGQYDVETTVDIRTLPHYKAAKATGIACGDGAVDQSGYRVSRPLAGISDRARWWVHRVCRREHHRRCPLALSRSSSRQSSQHDDHRGTRRRHHRLSG